MDENNKWIETTIKAGDIGWVDSGKMVQKSTRSGRQQVPADYTFVRKSDNARAKLPHDYRTVIKHQ